MYPPSSNSGDSKHLRNLILVFVIGIGIISIAVVGIYIVSTSGGGQDNALVDDAYRTPISEDSLLGHWYSEELDTHFYINRHGVITAAYYGDRLDVTYEIDRIDVDDRSIRIITQPIDEPDFGDYGGLLDGNIIDIEISNDNKSIIFNSVEGDLGAMRLVLIEDDNEEAKLDTEKGAPILNQSSVNNTGWLLYDRTDLGISGRYPPVWSVHEENGAPFFWSPNEESVMIEVKRQEDISYTLDDQKEDFIYSFESYQTDIIASNREEVSGYPANVFIFNDPIEDLKGIYVYIIKDGKEYNIIYGAPPSYYETGIGTFKAMIGTLQI